MAYAVAGYRKGGRGEKSGEGIEERWEKKGEGEQGIKCMQ